MDKISTLPWLRRLALLPALLLGLATAALAQDADPPGRVAAMSQAVGSVVFAPEGDNEWTDLPLNRPLTRGDRIWTDQGARAELHMGSAALHMDSQSHLAFYELDDDETQLSLTQGSINLRVRDLARRENMEVDTPNLAVRAMTPGDFRVDVDPADGTTRIAVRSGEVAVFGERGQSLRLSAGQQMTFAGRDLEQVRGRYAGTDDFDQWAADLNRREDQSVTARYVPRGVVGYQALDAYGTWEQDATYGAVWYPRVTVVNWAPYRYGHWSYIRPWGWTWVDEAPWGFAPFHYGRWAMIGSRWCWVPGSFGPRPVYSPALVAFVGGGSGVNFSFSIGSGPGIGWYPLGPGEAWYPTYRTSNVYITNLNRNIVLDRNRWTTHVNRRFDNAITAMRVDDFNRGVSVRDHWQRVRPGEIGGAAPLTSALPQPSREVFGRGGDRRGNDRQAPRLIATPPAATTPFAPSRNFGQIGGNRGREVREERGEERRERGNDARRPFVRQDDGQGQGQGRENRERFEQQRTQQERALQDRTQQDRAQREQERVQRERAQRDQERVQREQERNQREQQRSMQEQRERQQRAQQEAQERQREQAVRQQQERVQREQERAQREAQRDAQRQQREQQRMQHEERVQQQQQQQQQRIAVPQERERPQPQVGGQGRGLERGRAQEADESRGRGQGGGRFQKQDDGDDDKRGRGRNG